MSKASKALPDEIVRQLRESWLNRDEEQARRDNEALPELPDDPNVVIAISIHRPPQKTPPPPPVSDDQH